eukprot:176825-Prymnesium_polylepis.1
MTLSPLAPVHCRSCATTDSGGHGAAGTGRAVHVGSKRGCRSEGSALPRTLRRGLAALSAAQR